MARFPGNDIISLVGEAPRFDLAESVGPDLRLARLLDGSGSECAELPLSYGTAEGDRRLRLLIADQHGVGADDVVITVGGVHALFLLAFDLCGSGDEAVIATPCFPPTRDTLTAVGATLRELPLAFDDLYQPDPPRLHAMLSPRTKLVSLASPQNPSGVAIAPAALSEILSAIREVSPGAYLIVDETYREAAYGDTPVASSAVGLGREVVSVASLSKCHGAPGLRIGWAITRDAALREQLIRAKFNTVICCSPLDETLAARLLDDRAAIPEERRCRLAEGREIVAAWVARNRHLVEWVPPDAGALCCIRLKPGVFEGDAVAPLRGALAGIYAGRQRHLVRR